MIGIWSRIREVTLCKLGRHRGKWNRGTLCGDCSRTIGTGERGKE